MNKKAQKILGRVGVVLTLPVLVPGMIMAPKAATFTKSTDNYRVVVYVDNEQVEFPDQQPYINSDGRTMVPVRFVSEAIGAKVDWNATDSRVDIGKGSSNLQLWINNSGYNLNGETKYMDTQAILTSLGRTMVPLRFVSEGLGMTVDYQNVGGVGMVFAFTDGTTQDEITSIEADAAADLQAQIDAGGIDADAPMGLPTVRVEADQYNSIFLNTEQETQYRDYLASTIYRNNATGEFNFYVPLAPKGFEWNLTIKYSNSWDANVRTLLLTDQDVIEDGRWYEFNIPYDQGQKYSIFCFGLRSISERVNNGVTSGSTTSRYMINDMAYYNPDELFAQAQAKMQQMLKEHPEYSN